MEPRWSPDAQTPKRMNFNASYFQRRFGGPLGSSNGGCVSCGVIEGLGVDAFWASSHMSVRRVRVLEAVCYRVSPRLIVVEISP